MSSTDAYQVHNWVAKEVIRKDTLNHAEQGIYKNNVGVRALEDTVSDMLLNLAPVESTDIASESYSVDDILVWGAKLCKVTSAITSGETLSFETNLQRTSIAQLLTS